LLGYVKNRYLVLISAISNATTGVKKEALIFLCLIVHFKITSANLQLFATSFFYLKGQ
jgi:hypothetical protein